MKKKPSMRIFSFSFLLITTGVSSNSLLVLRHYEFLKQNLVLFAYLVAFV